MGCRGNLTLCLCPGKGKFQGGVLSISRGSALDVRIRRVPYLSWVTLRTSGRLALVVDWLDPGQQSGWLMNASRFYPARARTSTERRCVVDVHGCATKLIRTTHGARTTWSHATRTLRVRCRNFTTGPSPPGQSDDHLPIRNNRGAGDPLLTSFSAGRCRGDQPSHLPLS